MHNAVIQQIAAALLLLAVGAGPAMSQAAGTPADSGRIVAVLNRAEATEEVLGAYMTGAGAVHA